MLSDALIVVPTVLVVDVVSLHQRRQKLRVLLCQGSGAQRRVGGRGQERRLAVGDRPKARFGGFVDVRSEQSQRFDELFVSEVVVQLALTSTLLGHPAGQDVTPGGARRE